jgi:hypothetical protein
MDSKRRTIVGLFAGLVAVLVAVSLGTMAQGQDNPEPAKDDGSASGPSLDGGIPRGLQGLAERREPADALPASLAAAMGGPSGRGPQLYPGLSRKGITQAGGGGVYLVPSSEGVCAVNVVGADASGVACSTNADLEQGTVGPSYSYSGCGMADGRSECRELELYGLAPDGVVSVEVWLEGGGSTVAGVTRNVYVVELGGAEPASIALKDADGATRADVSLSR